MALNQPRMNVAHAFIAGKKGKSGAMTTDGQRVYSYGLLLAWKTPEGKMFYAPGIDEKHSNTTTTHQNALRRVLGELETKKPDRG